ncbi:MAG TPA: parallel beta-helix domain-containing protein [Myxococcota bacterium]|jgi:parallel beta-helix repeat protein
MTSRRLSSLLGLAACAAAAFALASVCAAETFRVRAGESIGRALEHAPPGSTIEVEPGTYHESLVVDTPGITLRGIVSGAQRPVLDGQGKRNDGVIASGSPFTMSGFAVQHYRGNGVTTQQVDGATLSDLILDDTGRYGVYPIQSRNVAITHCSVTKISDAGIYVGESERAVVAYNEVFGNVAGIEIENTNDADVHDNVAHDNTAGILVFVLPGKVLKEAKRNRVHHNWVIHNNTENFGDPNAIIGQLAYGIGILVMGADDTLVENNWVRDNHSSGIGVIRLAPEEAAKDPELEPMADGTRVLFNYAVGNGTRPHPSITAAYGGGLDFGWDGTGRDNCVSLPDSSLRRGAPLGACSQPDAARGASEPAAPHHGSALDAVFAAAAPDAASPDLSAADAVVHIRAMAYHPKHLRIARGATVAWVNDDTAVHTVTSGHERTPTLDPLQSPVLTRGQVYQYAFTETGTYEYLCLPHMDQLPMRGATVTVK